MPRKIAPMWQGPRLYFASLRTEAQRIAAEIDTALPTPLAWIAEGHSDWTPADADWLDRYYRAGWGADRHPDMPRLLGMAKSYFGATWDH